MSACTKGYVDIVKILLEKGAEINKQDQDGWTALHWASDEGHQAVVDILLEANPDLSIFSNCKRPKHFKCLFRAIDKSSFTG